MKTLYPFITSSNYLEEPPITLDLDLNTECYILRVNKIIGTCCVGRIMKLFLEVFAFCPLVRERLNMRKAENISSRAGSYATKVYIQCYDFRMEGLGLQNLEKRLRTEKYCRLQ